MGAGRLRSARLRRVLQQGAGRAGPDRAGDRGTGNGNRAGGLVTGPRDPHDSSRCGGGGNGRGLLIARVWRRPERVRARFLRRRGRGERGGHVEVVPRGAGTPTSSPAAGPCRWEESCRGIRAFANSRRPRAAARSMASMIVSVASRSEPLAPVLGRLAIPARSETPQDVEILHLRHDRHAVPVWAPGTRRAPIICSLPGPASLRHHQRARRPKGPHPPHDRRGTRTDGVVPSIAAAGSVASRPCRTCDGLWRSGW